MSFSVAPKAAPIPPEAQSLATAQEARARAIAKFTAGAPQTSHSAQLNQNAISAEDLSAISPNVGQKSSNEATSDPAPAPASSTEEPLSPQYAVLARKEKALRAKAQAQEQAYKAKEAALLAREEALKAKETTYQTDYVPKDKLQNDTWNILSELGYTYEQLTEMALNQSQETPAQRAAVQRLEAKIKALEDAQNKTNSSYQEQQTKAYQQAVSQIRRDATQLVDSDPVKYEAISKSGTVGEVVALIERTFKEDNVLLSVEEAAEEVEKYLIDQASKYAQFKKVQERLNTAKPAAPKQEGANSQAQSPAKASPTLTNAMGSQRPLTVKERAILAFKGELK